MKATGLFRAAGESRWRTQRLLVLGYHGVSLEDEHLWDPELFLSPAVFASRMEQVHRSGAAVLPLHEALERLRAGTLPPLAVALTFDDGLANFHHVVQPILQRYQFPGTVYLTTHYCVQPLPVCNLAWRYILWKARGQKLELARFTGKQDVADLTGSGTRVQVFDAICRFTAERDFSTAAKDELAELLASTLNVDYDRVRRSRIFGQMNPDEVRKVSEAGVSVELHTHRHRTPLDHQLFLREINDNRAWIQDVTGVAPRHFCYPSGQWHRAFFPWLAESGVQSATTCDVGMATPESSPFLIPRLIDTSFLTPIEFEAWLSGAGAMMPGRALLQSTR